MQRSCGTGSIQKGGGRVRVEIRPPKPRCADIIHFSEKADISGLSVASSELEGRDVALRQAESAKKRLEEANISGKVDIEQTYVDSVSPGAGIVLFTGGDMYLGASAVGEPGKRAESIGEEAALQLIDELKAKACVDKYLCDQLIPILAISGGSIKTSEITKHTETNIWVVEKFIDGLFNVNKYDKIVSFDLQKPKKHGFE
ncbi:MAG: RNA 3'-terminal phosphate cyclase [archaeon]